jgi:hypothetical protein
VSFKAQNWRMFLYEHADQLGSAFSNGQQRRKNLVDRVEQIAAQFYEAAEVGGKFLHFSVSLLKVG